MIKNGSKVWCKVFSYDAPFWRKGSLKVQRVARLRTTEAAGLGGRALDRL